MKVTALMENTSGREGCVGEFGLSFLVEANGRCVLFDAGQSATTLRNAEALGINLAQADLAVLSHAHYDHADGMPHFLARNHHASLYLSSACAETCWSTKGGTTEAHYIGIKQGFIKRYRDRLVTVATCGTTTIAPGVHLVPHSTPNLAEAGRQAGMWLCEDDSWRPDDFAHEISLVVELGDSADAPLAIFNSCSHAGLPTIVAEVQAAFPGRAIASYAGGLHLVHASDEDVLRVADAIESAHIGQLLTGHCTGAHALELLQRRAPCRIVALRPGLCVTL